MDKLRILYLIPVANLGGEELSTLSLCEGLSARGHQVEVATSGGSFVPEFDRGGVRVRTMPLAARRPIGVWRASRFLRRLLTTEPYDVVHAQEVFPAAMAALADRIPSRLPFRTIYHYRGVRPRRIPWVARTLPPCVDHVVTNSRYIRDVFIRHGVPPHRIQEIYNGFRWERFAVSHSRSDVRAEWGIDVLAPVAGVIARLHPVKGHPVFFEAAARTLRELPDARFVVIGDGPIRTDLEQAVAALGLGERVRFLGSVTDIPRALTGLDLVVLPSTEEAIGRVLVEAHAAGLPAIASRVGGTGEVVEDEVTGYLVTPSDPGELAGRMSVLLGDPELSREMGRRGRERVHQRFGFEEMIDRTETLYRKLVEEGADRKRS